MTLNLRALTCGHLTGDLGYLMEGGEGKADLPIPAYLIEHPKGTALFDTGPRDADRDALALRVAFAQSRMRKQGVGEHAVRHEPIVRAAVSTGQIVPDDPEIIDRCVRELRVAGAFPDRPDIGRHTPHPGRRNERQSLYWRSKRNFPRDLRRDRPAGVQVRSRCSKHWDSPATPGRRARSDQSTMQTSQWPLEGYRDSNRQSLS